MKVAVIGAGAMGQVTIRDLVESQNVSSVLIADMDLARAEALKKALGGGSKISCAKADVSDSKGLATVLSGYGCVINCTPYYFNVNVMEAALQAGCHYTDLGGLFHVTRKQLELHDKFVAKNLLAVPGMGAAPGLTNVMAAYAANELTTVENIDIVAASVDLVETSHPFLPPYALDTILDEYFLEPYVFEGGEFKALKPMSGEEMIDFPQPVGKAAAFLTLHSEVATLPITYKSKGVQRVTYRLGLPAEFHERAKFLVDMGFGRTEAVDVNGTEVKPRKMLASMIALHPVPSVEPDDCEVIRVDVSGTKDGKPAFIRLESVVHSHKEWKVGCGALDTGVPPSVVAQLILQNKITQRGVLAPEVCVPPQELFSELAKRGIPMRCVTDETIAQSSAAAKKTAAGCCA